MKTSHEGISMLSILEAVRLTPYDDQTGKRIDEWCKGATIGIGHLIQQNDWRKYKKGITYKCALKLLEGDLEGCEAVVNIYVKKELTQHEFDALVILTFNIGINGFKISSALKLINNPNAETPYSSLEHAWKAWNKQTDPKTKKKIVKRGLIGRRNKEWTLYSQGVYT